MHRVKKWTVVTVASVVAGVLVFGLGIRIMYVLDQRYQEKFEADFNSVVENLPEDLVGLRIQMSDIDVEQGFATLTVLPTVYGEYFGYPMNNGWYPKFPINLQIDSALPQGDDGSNSFYFENDYQGGFDALLDLAPGSPRERATVKWYPFDEYHFTSPVGGMYAFPCAELDARETCTTADIEEYRRIDPSIDDDGWADLPIFMHPYQSSADGFIASMRPMSFSDEWNAEFSAYEVAKQARDGFTSMGISVRRDFTSQFAAIFVLALMLATAVSVVVMAIVVASRHRPPTISALVWAAALSFALLQMRGLFPGSPPLGTWVDYVIYFPSLLVTMGCALWILVMWARRADWQ